MGTVACVYVTAGKGFTVSPVHGTFVRETRPVYAEGRESFNPKHMVIRSFAPAGAAGIGHANVNSEPQKVGAEPRPSLSTIMTALPGVIGGTIVAQRDTGNIGCRIVVGGAVEAERSAHEVNTDIQWLGKGA